MLLVISEVSGRSLAPQYIKLKDFKNNKVIKHLLNNDLELREAFNISITPGKNNNIFISNKSSCKIQKFGVSKGNSHKLEMKNYDIITIMLNEKPIRINLNIISLNS